MPDCSSELIDDLVRREGGRIENLKVKHSVLMGIAQGCLDCWPSHPARKSLPANVVRAVQEKPVSNGPPCQLQGSTWTKDDQWQGERRIDKGSNEGLVREPELRSQPDIETDKIAHWRHEGIPIEDNEAAHRTLQPRHDRGLARARGTQDHGHHARDRTHPRVAITVLLT